MIRLGFDEVQCPPQSSQPGKMNKANPSHRINQVNKTYTPPPQNIVLPSEVYRASESPTTNPPKQPSDSLQVCAKVTQGQRTNRNHRSKPKQMIITNAQNRK
jgi:hypothetical protein